MEEGLKKLIGRESYAMVFSSGFDSLGNHPVKEVRIYPRGQSDACRYVRIRPSHVAVTGAGTQPVGSGMASNSEEVKRRLSRNDARFRSAVARRTEAEKNRSLLGKIPGGRTPLQTAINRAKEARRFRKLKAGALARHRVLQAEEYARIHRKSYAGERDGAGHYREEMLQEQRFTEATKFLN